MLCTRVKRNSKRKSPETEEERTKLIGPESKYGRLRRKQREAAQGGNKNADQDDVTSDKPHRRQLFRQDGTGTEQRYIQSDKIHPDDFRRGEGGGGCGETLRSRVVNNRIYEEIVVDGPSAYVDPNSLAPVLDPQSKPCKCKCQCGGTPSKGVTGGGHVVVDKNLNLNHVDYRNVRSAGRDAYCQLEDSYYSHVHPKKHTRLKEPIYTEIDTSSGPPRQQDYTATAEPVYGTLTRRKNKNKDHGQLNVAVYTNSGLLTVHVKEAKDIHSRGGEVCNTYAKVWLYPDTCRATRCKTEILYNSMQPKFDEKFSFELLQEDLYKRVVISIWHQHAITQPSELLGCMSFGLTSILQQKKIVDGWYYLLPETVGKRKHLQVAPHDRHAPPQREPLYNTPRNSGSSPEVGTPMKYQHIVTMEPYVFVIRRGPDGYGFNVSGSGPAVVSKVEEGSPAESVGLQRDDCIMRINGLEVASAIADIVARIIKDNQKKIIMEIQRPTRNVPPGKEDQKGYDETVFTLDPTALSPILGSPQHSQAMSSPDRLISSPVSLLSSHTSCMSTPIIMTPMKSSIESHREKENGAHRSNVRFCVSRTKKKGLAYGETL